MYTLCKIRPESPFHLGTQDDLESTSCRVHSDTLFSGICNSLRMLYGNDELESFLGYYDEKMPVLLSSTFPYCKDTLLFPVPKSVDLSNQLKPKVAKQVEFVSLRVFKELIKGREPALNEDMLRQGRRVLLSDGDDDRERFWVEREIPRVVIDRKTSASTIYHFSEVIFEEDCGLFFLLHFTNSEWKGKVRASIYLLGDEGIGGDRSYGKGLFKVECFDEFELRSEGEWYVTLSLYFPAENEIELLQGYYDLIQRKGWIYSPDGKGLRRKGVRMFAEGSVFKFSNERAGKLVDVSPDEFKSHRVWRYGYAFPIRMEGVS